MKISLREVAAMSSGCQVVILAVDLALYQAYVKVEGAEHLLVGDDGLALRSHSLEEMRELLRLLPVTSLVLRQHSAYDEMIGQPARDGRNTLEVPLALPEETPPVLH